MFTVIGIRPARERQHIFRRHERAVGVLEEMLLVGHDGAAPPCLIGIVLVERIVLVAGIVELVAEGIRGRLLARLVVLSVGMSAAKRVRNFVRAYLERAERAGAFRDGHCHIHDAHGLAGEIDRIFRICALVWRTAAVNSARAVNEHNDDVGGVICALFEETVHRDV